MPIVTQEVISFPANTNMLGVVEKTVTADDYYISLSNPNIDDLLANLDAIPISYRWAVLERWGIKNIESVLAECQIPDPQSTQRVWETKSGIIISLLDVLADEHRFSFLEFIGRNILAEAVQTPDLLVILARLPIEHRFKFISLWTPQEIFCLFTLDASLYQFNKLYQINLNYFSLLKLLKESPTDMLAFCQWFGRNRLFYLFSTADDFVTILNGFVGQQSNLTSQFSDIFTEKQLFNIFNITNSSTLSVVARMDKYVDYPCYPALLAIACRLSKYEQMMKPEFVKRREHYKEKMELTDKMKMLIWRQPCTLNEEEQKKVNKSATLAGIYYRARK